MAQPGGAADEQGSWQALSPETFRQRFRLAPPSMFQSVMLGSVWFHGAFAAIMWLDGWSRVYVSLAVLGLVTALWIALTALTNPPVLVDLARDLLRIRGRIIPLSEVDRAAVLVTRSDKRGRTYGIRFGKNGVRMATVMIRVDEKIVLDAERAARLAAALERSEIRMPHDGNDPRAKSARYDFPNNVDRATAISLVREPPSRDQQLPIAGLDRYSQR